MEDYKSLSDYQLCKKRNEDRAIKVLIGRYKNLIHKYAYHFHRNCSKGVDIEDLLQDFTIQFFKGLFDIDFNKIKHKENFTLTNHMCLIFNSLARKLKTRYAYEIFKKKYTNIEFEYDEEDCDYDFIYGKSESNKYDHTKRIFIFDDLKNFLGDVEFDVIYRIFVLNEQKISIARSYGMKSNLFHWYYERLIRKIRHRYINEKEYLLT